METLFDPLFYMSWTTGFFLSLLLPVIGLYLRLRDEWLAALGLAQVSAAGGLVAFGLGAPVMAGSAIAALAIATLKHISNTNNTAYAFMIIGGWSLTFLIAANTALGESLGHALIQGQLYFVQKPEAITSFLLCMAGLMMLRGCSTILLRARLFPHYEQLNEKHAPRWSLLFDILVAISMGVGTASIGLMCAFTMAFVPAWLAFKLSASWKHATGFAIGFNVLGFVTGLACAILLDQPYGPTQVCVYLILAVMTLIILNPKKHTR